MTTMRPGDGIKVLFASVALGLCILGWLMPRLTLASMFALAAVSIALAMSKEL